MNKEDALRAIYKGESTFYAVNFLGLTFALLYLWLSDPKHQLAEAASEPTFYVWFLVGILIGYGIGRTSRIMALLAFSFCFLSFATAIVASPAGIGPDGILIALLILYFLVGAVKGSFAYHSQMKADDPSYKATKVWHILIGAPLALLVFLFFVLGFALQTGIITEEDLEGERDLQPVASETTPDPSRN